MIPNEPRITPELVAAHGLKPEEYERVIQLIGREPTITELGIFSAMWNEHCSYKSSKVHLRTLPTKAPAAKLYTEGLTKLRAYECQAARTQLERAVAADAVFALARAALAEAEECLGHDDRAKVEAQRALELAVELPEDQRLRLEARVTAMAGGKTNRRELYRQGLRQPDHAELARRVRPDQPVGPATRAGGRVDDTASEPLGDHLPPHVLEHEKRPGQVDVDDSLPDVVVELGESLVLRIHELNVGRAGEQQTAYVARVALTER